MQGSTQAETFETTASGVYKRARSHHSDFEGHNGVCARCGLATFNAPDIHNVHPIRMQYQTENGDVYCEACFFEYDRSGVDIVDDSDFVELYKTVVKTDESARECFYFENWQAASGLARRNTDAEYRGEVTVDCQKLQRVD